jgi:hypothetical protein
MNGCSALRPVIPDAIVLRHVWPGLAILPVEGNDDLTLLPDQIGLRNFSSITALLAGLEECDYRGNVSSFRAS